VVQPPDVPPQYRREAIRPPDPAAPQMPEQAAADGHADQRRERRPSSPQGDPGRFWRAGIEHLFSGVRKILGLAPPPVCTACTARTTNVSRLCDVCDERARKEQAAQAREREQATARSLAERAEQRARASEGKRRQLAEEARQRAYLLGLSPKAFEAHVAQLFSALGYAVRLTPSSNDAGVDAYIEKDGHPAVVQCKRFTKGVVSRPELQQFYGVLMHERALEGFFVTTARFTPGAMEFVNGKPIHLIDLEKLIEMASRAFTDDFIRSGPSGTQTASRTPWRRRHKRGWR
jgi:restriction system protein